MHTAKSYTAAMPGSYERWSEHQAFVKLFDKFTKHHEINTGDIPRLWSLILNCTQVLHEGVAGAFAEVGIYKGNSAAVLAEFAKSAGRPMYLFDTFNGFNPADLTGVDGGVSVHYADTSIGIVKEVLGDAADICTFVPGYFPDSLTVEHKQIRYAAVSIDCDLYKPIKASLEVFYPLLSLGGIFFIHDYSSRYWVGATQAVDEFCKATGEYLVAMPDLAGSAFIRKTRENH